MGKDEKYREYLQLCKQAGEIPFSKDNISWTTHKGKLVQTKGKEPEEQTAADDFLDYLDSQY